MLFIVVIGDRSLVIDTAQSLDRVSLIQQGIGQAGLARGAVPNERNVPDVLDKMFDRHDVDLKMGKDTCFEFHQFEVPDLSVLHLWVDTGNVFNFEAEIPNDARKRKARSF